MTTVNMFWTGPALTTMERLAMASFLRWNFHVVLWTYLDPPPEVPAGVEVRSAVEVLPADWCFTYLHGTHAACSNVFRWVVLGERGGWWADCDTVLLRQPRKTRDFLAAWEDPPGLRRTDAPNRIVGAGFVYASSNHPVIRYCAEYGLRVGRNVSWGYASSRILTEAIQKLGYLDSVLPETTIYPVHYSQTRRLLESPAIRLPEDAFAVHLSRSVWNRSGWSTEVYPPDCLYASLVRRFLEGSDS